MLKTGEDLWENLIPNFRMVRHSNCSYSGQSRPQAPQGGVWQGLWVCLNIPPEREAATPTSVHCVCLTPLMASNKKRGTHATLQGGSIIYVSSRGQGNRQMRVGKRIHGQEMKEAIYQKISDFKKGISGSNPDRRKKEKRGQNSLISER